MTPIFARCPPVGADPRITRWSAAEPPAVGGPTASWSPAFLARFAAFDASRLGKSSWDGLGLVITFSPGTPASWLTVATSALAVSGE